MNKFVIVAVAFAVVAVSAQGPGGPNFIQYMQECKAETGATDADLSGMRQHQPPTDMGYCVMACIQKKSGVLGADNKINLEKAQQEMAPLKQMKPAEYEKLIAAMQACKPQVESNPANLASTCAAGKAYGECMHSKM